MPHGNTELMARVHAVCLDCGQECTQRAYPVPDGYVCGACAYDRMAYNREPIAGITGFTQKNLRRESMYFEPNEELKRSQRLQKAVIIAVLAIAAMLFAAVRANAQTFDPDPDAPNAVVIAEMRATGAFLGLTSPPIGWECVFGPRDYGDIVLPAFICAPDPLLIEQQERERREWDERFVERSKFLRRR